MTRCAEVPVLGVDPERADGWPAAARSAVEEHGAVVVRGIGLRSPSGLAGAVRALGAEPVAEREQFARRSTLADKVYTASEWPPEQPMCVHQEQTYRPTVPSLMLFGCIEAADQGGGITLVDCAEILPRLPQKPLERLEREGWLVLRNYSDDYIGMPWFEAFGTHDRAAVEEYCRAHAIEFGWHRAGLRTRQRRPASLHHPVSGRRCWFNQAAFLNSFSLDPVVREVLIAAYGPDRLPFDTRYGGGAPIEECVVQEINDVFRDAEVPVPLRTGDLLIVDNLRTAHGREAFTGERELVVAPAQPVAVSACRPVPSQFS